MGRTEKNIYKKSIVDDKFFKLAEMEQFVEKAEKQAENNGNFSIIMHTL